MGEPYLSSFLDQVLCDRLASHDFLDSVRQLHGGDVDSELKKWEKELKVIQAVLRDAEEKQQIDDGVKLWLEELQDLAYDAEDILDEFATQVLELKLMAKSNDQASTSEIRSNLNPNIVKSLTTRLEELCKQRVKLGLQLTPGGTSSTDALRRPYSSNVSTGRDVVGRDEHKAKILEMVLSEAPNNDANIQVIAILGIAGIGKTTLAREVYNDKSVQDFKFHIKQWLCVSDGLDVFGISRFILESITFEPCELKTLNEVQVRLRRAVTGKRVLLVLDDVWNEDYNLWEDLNAPLLAAAPNSKVIVTTRHSRVASTMGPVERYNLKYLSDNDCWSLFTKHAFEGRDINAHQISEFRDGVVKMSGGLPLSAKILAALFRSNTGDTWYDILNNNILNSPQRSGILPALQLSYYYFPSHLKRCFAYCALFPKDHEFEKNEVVLLWIAEAIIQQSRNDDKQLEDCGSEYSDDLVSRSIFQQSNTDSSKFIMHDLIHDLAQVVSGEPIFRLEGAKKQPRGCERVRHSSYTRGEFDGKNKFQNFYEVENLRTFLPILIR